jgi:heptose I phosphotransferase
MSASFILDPDFARLLQPAERDFDALMAIEGTVMRAKEGRRTIAFRRGGRDFYIKQHRGVGWAEIARNLLILKLPVIGARNEWLALQALATAGIDAPRPVAFGERGANPARRQSFVVTAALGDTVTLEDLTRDWRDSPPPVDRKRRLIAAVGAIARRMHVRGINHRDFYLCHILKDRDGDRLYLLDLHRAGLRRAVPRRWLLKDLAGLLMSALGIGLTRRDRLRFVAAYTGRPWRAALAEDRAFWDDIARRAVRLKQRLAGRDPS